MSSSWEDDAASERRTSSGSMHMYTLYAQKVEIARDNLKLRTRRNPKLYVEIAIVHVLPGQNERHNRTFRTPSVPLHDSQAVPRVTLAWSKRFTISLVLSSSKSSQNSNTARIIFRVKKERRICQDVVLGEADIGIDELIVRCQNGSDFSLTLRARDVSFNHDIGTIVVRLEPAPGYNESGIADARDNLSLIQQDAKYAGIEESGTPGISTAVETGEEWKDFVDQTDALPILDSLRSRLDKLGVDKLRPFVEVIDEIAKIHPYVNTAWKGLFTETQHEHPKQLYKQKVKMEKDVMEAIAQMNDILSFVEDMQTLREKIKSFLSVIEEVLRVIDECGQCVLRYLDSSVAGRTWKAFAEAEQFDVFKTRLDDLSQKLTRAAAGQAAIGVVKIEGQNNQIISTLEEMKKSQEGKRFDKSNTLNLAAPPNPSSIFTGREECLKMMEEKYEFPKTSIEVGRQRRFVLCGPGGAGKTQLALTFLKRYRFTVQYMIDATSETTLANSFKSIGESSGIPDADTTKVLRWLCELKEDWILIYDNADNHGVKYASYIPDCSHGNILMTTRNPENRALAPLSCHIEVSSLDKQSAIHLLYQSARLERTTSSERIAEKIVEELGYLALGIVQAGSYMATVSDFFDLEEYHSLFQENRARLLAADLGPEIPYKDPVYTTWEISFNALTPMAQFFIQFCSLLYRDGITEELFRRAVTSKRTTNYLDSTIGNNAQSPSLCNFIRHLRNENDEWDIPSFRTLIRNLRSYSLLQESSHGVYRIHPLIHAWARDRMKRTDRDSMQNDAIHLLYFSLPHHMASDVVFLRKLLPHLDFCGDPKDTKMMSAFASVYFTCGRAKDAQALWSQVLQEHKENLGVDDPKTLACMGYLSSTYRQENRLDIAEKLQEDAVRGLRKVLGNEHRETLITMGNLALTYQRQGRLPEAEELQKEILTIRKRLVGEDNQDTLIVKSGLSEIYLKRGQLIEAERLAYEASTGLRRKLGSEDLDTVTATGRLASVYYQQGRLEEAGKLLHGVVEIRIRVLGAESRLTLYNMDQLALTYRDLGRLDEAIKLEEIVVEASQRVNGSDHPQTVRYKENLGSIHRKQGYAEGTESTSGKR